jgi:hypothetical protein
MKKKFEMICGCHVEGQNLIHCNFHASAPTMAAVLRMLRQYFLDTTGEESPFVKKIDEILPR